MPETAIKFGSYEAAKRALANFEGHGDPRHINSYSKFTAGGVAGMIAQSDMPSANHKKTQRHMLTPCDIDSSSILLIH